MSFSQTIAKYFSDHTETNDVHRDPSLQTHYYKTTSEKGLQTLQNLFQDDQRFRINAISFERGEISATIVKGKKAFIVATVIMVRPYRTAIDFSVTTESVLPFDFGYSYRLIQTLYNDADNELPRIESRN